MITYSIRGHLSIQKTSDNGLTRPREPTYQNLQSLLVTCLKSVPFHYLNVVELIKQQNAFNMMRIANKRHRPYQLGMKTRVITYSDGGYSSCQWQNEVTTNVGTWLRNIKGFFAIQSSSQVDLLSKENSLSSSLFSIE